MYGGTERVVSYLTEKLIEMGHDVTLFASGDSVTRARLVSCRDQSLRLDKIRPLDLPYHYVMIEEVFRNWVEFDVIHSHIDYLPFSIARRLEAPFVTTLHGRLDIPDLFPLFQEFKAIPLVSISNSQRRPMPWANWQGTVYHGLPRDTFRLQESPDDYLLFLGRISPEKQPDHAIEIARRAHCRLKIAAKVDPKDFDYFKTVIEPRLRDPGVEYVGEATDLQKQDLLGHARALLFPINWPEPFGLVIIEAMACGTPVIAYSQGSVPEIIDDGVTGFIVRTLEEAVQAVSKASSLNRRLIRRTFEKRFTSDRMAQDYLSIYERIAMESPHENRVYG